MKKEEEEEVVEMIVKLFPKETGDKKYSWWT